MSLVRTSYDPTNTAPSGDGSKKMVIPVREDSNDNEYVWVRLTAKGNQALLDVCFTDDQKEVWTFPSYEFLVRKGSLTVAQLKTARPSYVNAILIASRGVVQPGNCTRNTRAVFGENVRLPGYWGGACAGCKWKDGSSRCSYANRTEAKFVPTSVASLPTNAIEELED